MFRRRRPLRRPGRRPLQRLNEARRLFEKGRYDEAAQLFEHLAVGAAQRGMLNKGADLFVQAARCYLEAGHVDRALALGKRSLRLLGRAGLRGKAQARWSQMIEALEHKGYHAEAAALRGEAEAFLMRRSMGGPFAGRSHPRSSLPASCPNCGASVNLNEVTWARPDRAECAYCGRVIAAAKG